MQCDVRQQVNRGLEYIKAVVCADMVKAVGGIAALRIALESGTLCIESAFMSVAWDAVLIKTHKYGVMIFFLAILGFFTAFVEKFLLYKSVDHSAIQ